MDLAQLNKGQFLWNTNTFSMETQGQSINNSHESSFHGLVFIFSNTDEQSNGSQAFEASETGTWTRNTPRRYSKVGVATPPAGKFPMHNETPIQFESLKVPVIFVLGGPGSGKVTHCDTLVQENKGIVHINVSDLLQQYAIGNDVMDYGQLSSKTVTEVLMVEMKMAPHAKTYLVSGYPRNMRDVVEYSEKIRVLSGVVLISWRQKILERQIEYGAKLGQLVLSLAKLELNNFYKHVLPVAEYFDQSSMLISIHGERPPSDVYKDFKAAVLKILGNEDDPPVFGPNNEQTVPTTLTTAEVERIPSRATRVVPYNQISMESNGAINNRPVTNTRPKTQVIQMNSSVQPSFDTPVKPTHYPPVVWVIGGPGSNKASLCGNAAKKIGWAHISLGKLLRISAEPSDLRNNNEVSKVKDAISSGELVPTDIVMKVMEIQLESACNAKGIILDGFPRDMTQVQEFESRFKQKPTLILLDCSKLQLGKGRLDDSVTAFRRRLEIFRQSSLPMLKTLDNVGRLTIVDGDTDTSAVQEDFFNTLTEHIKHTTQHQNGTTVTYQNGNAIRSDIPNGISNGHAIKTNS